jgi:serine/threonine-protein kinase RsbW
VLRALTIVVPARLECLAWLGSASRGIAREQLGSDADASLVELAVVEICSNVIRHGHPGDPAALVHVVFEGDGHCLQIEIRDEGPAFSVEQTAMPEIDTTMPVDDLPIGGFGIPIVHALMDAVEYSRDGNVNVVRISKCRPPP